MQKRLALSGDRPRKNWPPNPNIKSGSHPAKWIENSQLTSTATPPLIHIMDRDRFRARFSYDNRPFHTNGPYQSIYEGPAFYLNRQDQDGPTQLANYQPHDDDWFNFANAAPILPPPPPTFFSRDEINILRSAGFDRYARECLSTYPEFRRSFVIRNGPYLFRCGFFPLQQTNLSAQPRHLRQFFLEFAEHLHQAGFQPFDMFQLYQMPFGNIRFVLANAITMRSIGFTAPMMISFSRRRFAEKDFLIRNGPSLCAEGLNCFQIIAMARTSHVPASTDTSRQSTYLASPPERQQSSDHPSGQSLSIGSPSPNTQIVTSPQYSEQTQTEATEAVRAAHDRWNISLSLESARSFYDQIVPYALGEQIRGSEFHDLRLLLAGFAYMQDNTTTETSDRHLARITAVTDYISNAHDTQFLMECNSTANDNVGRCGDRISFGLTCLQQLIERRRVERNELTAHELLSSLERQFRQSKLIEIADRMAPQQTESVEFYLALSQELRRRGMNLIETTESSLYGNLYRPSGSQLAEVKQELDKHIQTPSSEYLKMVSTNLGVRDVLRRLFPVDFSKMDAEKEHFGTQADELIFKENVTPPDRKMGEELMLAAVMLENDWYRQRAADVIWQPSLLDGERVS